MHDNPWVIDGLFVEVDDVDAHHARAAGHGTTIVRGLDEPGIGYRIYTAEDFEGHLGDDLRRYADWLSRT
jgi:uncharacterized glyoxalase superfamily protein PhnB